MSGNLPLSKKDLSVMTEGPEGMTFGGLAPFVQELTAQYADLTDKLGKENTELKCHLLALVVVAVLAAAAAAWLFISQNDGGFYPAIGLTATSGCFIVGMAVAYIVASHQQKKLEKLFYEYADSETGSWDGVLRGMEQSTVEAIDLFLKKLATKETAKKKLFEQVFEEYQKKNGLTEQQKKVLNTLKKDPELIYLIREKKTPLAQSVLNMIDFQDTPQEKALQNWILRTMGPPRSLEEAQLLTRLPWTTFNLYLQELSEPFEYRMAFIDHLAADTAPHAHFLECLLQKPNTPEEASAYARNPAAVISKATNDATFATAMIAQLLPVKDQYQELVKKLLLIVGAPSTSTPILQNLFMRHPVALQLAMKENTVFALGCLPFVAPGFFSLDEMGAPYNTEGYQKFAEQPKTLVQLIHASPDFFTPYAMSLIFPFMTGAKKITFLKALSKSRTDQNFIARTEAVIKQLLIQEIPLHQKANYATTSTIPKEVSQLFALFGSWPSVAAEYLFNSEIDMDSVLMQAFLDAMKAEDRTQFISSAPRFLEKSDHAPSLFHKWLAKTDRPEWMKSIMVNSPITLAKALSCIEKLTLHELGETLFTKMTTDQKSLYQQTFLEHFLVYYEQQVFEKDNAHTKNLSERFIAQIGLLISGFQPINPKTTQRYFELLVNVEQNQALAKKDQELAKKDQELVEQNQKLVEQNQKLINEAMTKTPPLCPYCIVSLHGYEAMVPVYRLVALSSNFEIMFELLDYDPEKPVKHALDIEGRDFDSVKKHFIDYLSSGTTPKSIADPFALAYLAQRYQLEGLASHTASLIASMRSTVLYKLEKAFEWGLFDIKCLCLNLIMKNPSDKSMQNLHYRAVSQEIRDFITIGQRCQDVLMMRVTLENSQDQIKNSSKYGKYFTKSEMKRHVEICDVLPIPTIQWLYDQLQVNHWSAETPEIALQQCLMLDQYKPLTPILLQCAEASKTRPSLDEDFSIVGLLKLYKLAIHFKKSQIQSECLLAMKRILKPEDFDFQLQSSIEKYPELIGVCLEYISTLENPQIPTPILNCGMTCARLKIALEYKEGTMHVTLPKMDNDIAEGAANAVVAVNDVVPVSHVGATHDDWQIINPKFSKGFKFEKVYLSQKPKAV